jgi:hypothetical protein
LVLAEGGFDQGVVQALCCHEAPTR